MRHGGRDWRHRCAGDAAGGNQCDVHGERDGAGGNHGALINTATVTPPLGVTDPVPGNNNATDTNPAGPQADLTITKASSPNPYVPGAALSYTMVVSNAGPSECDQRAGAGHAAGATGGIQLDLHRERCGCRRAGPRRVPATSMRW